MIMMMLKMTMTMLLMMMMMMLMMMMMMVTTTMVVVVVVIVATSKPTMYCRRFISSRQGKKQKCILSIIDYVDHFPFDKLSCVTDVVQHIPTSITCMINDAHMFSKHVHAIRSLDVLTCVVLMTDCHYVQISNYMTINLMPITTANSKARLLLAFSIEFLPTLHRSPWQHSYQHLSATLLCPLQKRLGLEQSV